MLDVLACPSCHGALDLDEASLACRGCGRSFTRGAGGFFSFLVDPRHDPRQEQLEWYVEHQKTYPLRVYREFLKPLIMRAPGRVILDVGCGLGTEVDEAVKDSYEAYGIDLPNMEPYWRQVERDPARFFSCSAVRLPFRDSAFDVVWSFGVVEHIGTASDTATLTPAYREDRQAYASELIRVAKPGGSIIVSCPNKAFPIDIQHGPTCGRFAKLRQRIHAKTRMNIHKTWGKYHLLSYSEIKRLFMGGGTVERVEALPLKHYFGFNAFQSGYLSIAKRAVTFYIEHLPRPLLPTFLNPYMLAIVTKKGQVQNHVPALQDTTDGLSQKS